MALICVQSDVSKACIGDVWLQSNNIDNKEKAYGENQNKLVMFLMLFDWFFKKQSRRFAK